MKQLTEKDLAILKRMEITSINKADSLYPSALSHCKPDVPILFGKGNLSLLSDIKRVSIVGSRKPTAYGRKVAYDLSRFLAKRGVCVVSGMALGIDAQAHKGALDEGGKTIAVLASGVNYIYPQTNEKIYESIFKENGLILSEQFIDEPPRNYHFPLRNRIISALGDVVVIIEAGEKSGSLITAIHALEQGKTVFALPGSIYSAQSEGSNKLIFDGAIPLVNFEHILETIGVDSVEVYRKYVDVTKLSSLAQKIYVQLIERKNVSIDQIHSETLQEYSEIYAAVSELILDDLCDYLSLNEIKLI